MEYWPDFHYSPLEETSLHGLFSNQFEMEKSCTEWTFEENKIFENALAEIEPGCPAFFENVASKIPWKSTVDIKNHYQALIDDLNMIETGNFPVPDYNAQDNQDEEILMDAKKEMKGSPSNREVKTRSNGAQHRRRGVPWTEEEHQLFLMGLNKYGKGDWRSISRYYVLTKTPTQVASHAQKYFRRQTSSTPADRRRPSIHDIQTVNPITSINCLPNDINNETIPFSSTFGGLINPMPMFSSHDPIFNSTAGGYSGSYLFPSLGNRQWGYM